MKYFTIEEMCKTSYKVENKPTEEQTQALWTLVQKVLDVAREKLKMPIIVTSGFRCPTLNRLVGGSPTSQHVLGEAADLVCKDNRLLFEILSTMDYDQLIWEYGDDNAPAWVHVSYKANGKNRRQRLRIKKGGGYFSI